MKHLEVLEQLQNCVMRQPSLKSANNILTSRTAKQSLETQIRCENIGFLKRNEVIWAQGNITCKSCRLSFQLQHCEFRQLNI
jgi:hypothetical protein